MNNNNLLLFLKSYDAINIILFYELLKLTIPTCRDYSPKFTLKAQSNVLQCITHTCALTALMFSCGLHAHTAHVPNQIHCP